MNNKKLNRLAVKVEEAADLMGISKTSIYRLVSNGVLTPNKSLRHLLIPLRQIEKLINGDKI